MRKITTTLNIVLLGVIGLLIFLSVRTWTHPKYPLEIVAAPSGPLNNPQTISISNNPYNPGIIQSVIRSNLFRKDRREYTAPLQPPRPAAPIAPRAPRVPPPDLKLKGVMLLSGKSLAFLKGNLSVLDVNRSITTKPVKRRGYALGAQIGEYRLARIEKNEVLLDNNRGSTLRLKLVKKGSEEIIQRSGNAFTQKSKSFNPRKIMPAGFRKKNTVTQPALVRQARHIPTPRTIRISGAPTPANSSKKIPVGIPRPRISGR